MFDIRDILKAGVCSFCENIYEYNTLDKKDFIEEFKFFILEEDLQECLEYYTAEVVYDTENIENIWREGNLKHIEYELNEDLFNLCEVAFCKTINNDKTINVKSFVDNLVQKFTEH